MFHNFKLYADEHKIYPTHFRIRRECVHKLFKQLVRREGMSVADFHDTFQEYERYINKWDIIYDEHCNPTGMSLAYDPNDTQTKAQKKQIAQAKKSKKVIF